MAHSGNHAPGFLALVMEAKTRVHETNIPAVRRRIAACEQFTLIDVREDNEWAAGHIPGAIHLGRGVIERDIETAVPDPKTPIVLYCGGGFRSALTADNLQKMGYSAVESMDGGWRGWLEEQAPVERS
jgi:rhodanese-related sulfurtransferase